MQSVTSHLNFPTFVAGAGAFCIGHSLYNKYSEHNKKNSSRYKLINAVEALALTAQGLVNTKGALSIAKASIAWVQFFARYGHTQAIGILPVAKDFKDLVYTLSIVESVQPFIVVVSNNRYTIQLPRKKDQLGYDTNVRASRSDILIKICTVVADTCEFFTFLHKHQVCQVFTPLVQVAHRIGHAKVFPGLHGQKLSMDDLPWLHLFNTRLKDFIMLPTSVFSFVNLSRKCYIDGKVSSNDMKELASNAGKTGLILLGRYWAPADDWRGIAFALIDIFTQTIGLSKTIDKVDIKV